MGGAGAERAGGHWPVVAVGSAWAGWVECLVGGFAEGFWARLVPGVGCEAVGTVWMVERWYLRRGMSVLVSVLNVLKGLGKLRHGMLTRHLCRVLVLHRRHLIFVIP